MPTANLRVDFPPLPRRFPFRADRSLVFRAHHHRSSRAVDTRLASAPMIAPMCRLVICNRTRNNLSLSSRTIFRRVGQHRNIGSPVRDRSNASRLALRKRKGRIRRKRTRGTRSAALRIPLRRGAVVTPACKRQRVPAPPRKRKGTATRNETLPVRRTSGPTV